ncbi:uncharacterized protein LOC9650106 [Selaginella moellendorffii]|uniref:uncharacterized protein LOC9650106 n=1 Tax=Selaginella moellendorffii TaxID=88036 RepID=UPI000D1C5A19|nr:uncharacterized protein LOC9650106 [Selaginella moellendorffii]|eukprot:XP_024529300.1 uncharacterized protein LOC9650106 [Selaginella moellendorffii]
MKKRPSIFHRWKWRISVLALLFFLALCGLRFPSSPGTMPMPAASIRATVPEKIGAPRIALLFLARNRLAVEEVWDLFFKGAQEHLYSIYIHARPGFVYDATNTESSFFWNRQINNSVMVEWGEASMIDAERILLHRALQDASLSHFVLLSDSCIPLYSFNYIYKYITSSPKSFVDSFIESKNTRYNFRMFPTVTHEKWRKGSQWFMLLRKHAEIVVGDSRILLKFYEHCKRDMQPQAGRKYGMTSSENDCVPDEHYIQTLLAIKTVENEIERRTLTYTLWKASDRRENDRWHPVTFNTADVSAQTIKDIKGIHSIKYETEGRTEWCSCNGIPRACFLFARKFSRGAVSKLLHNNETDFFGFAAGEIAEGTNNITAMVTGVEQARSLSL